MADDYYRRRAYDAVDEWLDLHVSNAVTASQVWQAVNVALDRYDDEYEGEVENRPGWAIILDGHPMLIVKTYRQARRQRRLMKHLYDGGKWTLRRTQIATEP